MSDIGVRLTWEIFGVVILLSAVLAALGGIADKLREIIELLKRTR